ncbi:MAG TPA: carboxypeptidase regulatory-like domain-containing protein, partial [Longimicrobiales bacterium]|nr:carboxypeptidase regulatory-like domain-containing protein [Longimicrobiales bacterium]
MGSKLKMCFHALLAIGLFVAAPVSAQNGTITGVVTDADDGHAIGYAQINVQADGRATASTLTNAEGRYTISIEPGTYTVSVQNVGYEVNEETVSVTAGSTTTHNVALSTSAFLLNPVVVSASRGRQEKATETVSHTEVVSELEIEQRPAVTPVDHLRSVPGVDVITTGVQSTNVAVRGFNNIFSGSLHTLTDNRIAGIPSLRVNLMHFVPQTNEDIARMEVVLGPGSALYGPNTANGVLHIITKSPLDEQSTSVSLAGGERSMFHGTFRTAQLLSENFGVKVSGQYLRANEWEYFDEV